MPLTRVAHIATCVPDEEEEENDAEQKKCGATPFEFDNSSESEVPATPPKPGSIPPRAVFVVSPSPNKKSIDDDDEEEGATANIANVVAPQTVIKMSPSVKHRALATGWISFAIAALLALSCFYYYIIVFLFFLRCIWRADSGNNSEVLLLGLQESRLASTQTTSCSCQYIP